MYFFQIFLSLTLTLHAFLRLSTVNCDDSASDSVKEICNSIYCNFDVSIGCNLTDEAFGKSFLKNIILIHDGDWKNVLNFNNYFTKCGVNVFILDYQMQMDISQYKIYSSCSLFKKTAVISLNQASSFNANGSLREQISLKCPNTVWFDQHQNCATNYSKNLFDYNNVENALNNKILKIATLQRLPWVTKTTSQDGTYFYSGLVFEMIDKFSKAFNFSYRVVEPADEKYGSLLSNGMWNGLVGMLLQKALSVLKEVDMVAAELTVTYERAEVVDFSNTYYLETIGMILHTPKQDGRMNRKWRFNFLFSPTVWTTAIVGCLTSILVIYSLHKLFDNAGDAKGLMLVFNCIFYVFSSSVNQAANTMLSAWSSRAFLACFQMFLVSMFAMYGGTLTSLFVSSRTTMGIRDLASLMVALNEESYKTCVIGSTAFHSAVMRSQSNDQFYGYRLYLENHQDNVGKSLDDCTERLLSNPKLVFIGELVALENVQNKYCSVHQLMILNERFFPGFFALAFPKGSHFSESFSMGIVETIESGLLETWKLKYVTKPSFCELSASNNHSPANNALNITELIGAFLVLAVGICFAVALLFVELRDKFKQFNNSNVTNVRIFSRPSSTTMLSTGTLLLTFLTYV